MRRILLICLVLTLGCAAWIPAKGVYKAQSLNFSIEQPEGWMRQGTTEYVLLTKDGVLLQNIVIRRLDIDEPLKNTKKKVQKSMLPFEIAEVIVDDISSDQTVLNLEVVENVPVNVKGIPGFRLAYKHNNDDGLKIKSIIYGFLSDKWLYLINYNAAQRHYFDRDIDTFEGVFNSFKLL